LHRQVVVEVQKADLRRRVRVRMGWVRREWRREWGGTRSPAAAVIGLAARQAGLKA
jgi:hypothetical protein